MHILGHLDLRGRKMKKLTIREIRQSLSHLDKLLAVEEEIMITRRGDPIARVVQVGRKRPIPSHRDLREGMKQCTREARLFSARIGMRDEASYLF